MVEAKTILTQDFVEQIQHMGGIQCDASTVLDILNVNHSDLRDA